MNESGAPTDSHLDVRFLGEIDTDPAAPRPMLAILEARVDTVDAMRAAIIELVAEVRKEAGCLTFVPYESLGEPGHFYLYEVYSDLAAFQDHLATDHVSRFINTISTLSAKWPAYPIQLNEIAVSEPQLP